jgi:glycosyltransferase involved in cell wall biosynthesis
MNLFSPLPYVAQKYDILEYRKKIKEIILAEDIDMVHVDMLPLAQYRHEFKGLPMLLVDHNIEYIRLYRWYKEEKNFIKKAYLSLQWKKLKRYESNMLNKFDACIFVSDADRILAEKMNSEAKTFTVPNGTDTQFFQQINTSELPKSMVWFGHMDSHTNLDAVKYFSDKILPDIFKHVPDATVTFVGSHPPEFILKMASHDKRIRVTGEVDDIRPHVKNHKVIVVPLRIGGGTKLKVLDALAMSKAIVTTSVGAEGIDVKNGEEIFIEDTAQEFSSRVVTLLKDENLCNKIAKNAAEKSLSYDWKNIQKQQETVYQFIVNKTRTE